AVERSNAAVIGALTPSCVARFMQQPNPAVKLAEFQKIESWKQREFIEAGGWATSRGEKTPNSGVANACAEELAKTKNESQQRRRETGGFIRNSPALSAKQSSLLCCLGLLRSAPAGEHSLDRLLDA